MDALYKITPLPKGVSGKDEVLSQSISKALHFSIKNDGTTDVHLGFEVDDQPILLKPDQAIEFPWINPDCMRYDLTCYFKFGATAGSVQIISLHDRLD